MSPQRSLGGLGPEEGEGSRGLCECPCGLGTSRTKVPVLFCRCQQFTLVWMPPGPSADAETAAGLCPTPTELQEMLSRKKGCVGRRGVGEVVGGWGSSQTLEGPSGAGPGDAHVS